MTGPAQRLMAVIACVGVLMVAAGGAGVAAAATGSGSSGARAEVVAQPATAVAVSKFLLHAGLTYYVFDHYIWKPYKAGDLHGFTHKLTEIKAGLAALFVYHEAKIMLSDVKSSKLLTFLATPLTAAVAKLSSLKSDISGGNLNALNGVQSDLGTVKQQSNGKGYVIKEIEHSIA